MPQLVYHYSAFISYHHNDCAGPGRDWATWIKNMLEGFRTTPELAGKESKRYNDKVPASLERVFVDESVIAGGDELSPRIIEALKESRVLIVLCSPDAAASEWVNHEITEFKKLGRSEAIVPIILNGEPFAAIHPELECIPRALRHQLDANGVIDPQTNVELSWVDFRGPPAVVMKGSPALPTTGATSLEAYRAMLLSETRLREETVDECCAIFSVRFKEAQLKLLAGVLGLDKSDVDQVFKLRESRAIQDALAEQEAEKKRREAERAAKRHRLLLGAAAAVVLGGGWWAMNSLHWKPDADRRDHETPPPPPVAEKVKLFKADGSPLQGTVQAFRVPDRYDEPSKRFVANGVGFDMSIQSTDGVSHPKGTLVVLFNGVSADDPASQLAGSQVVVDPDAIWRNAEPWNAVRENGKGEHPGYKYAAWWAPDVGPSPAISSPKSPYIYAGKRGFVKSGSLPVRVIYTEDVGGKVQELGGADCTLNIPDAWTRAAKDQKLRLLNVEGKADIDQAPVIAEHLPRRLVNPFTLKPDPIQVCKYYTVMAGGAEPVQGPVTLHAYLLHARFDDEPPMDGKEIVIDRRLGWTKASLPQGQFIDLSSGEGWIPANRLVNPSDIDSPNWTEIHAGEKGSIPPGEHEIGLAMIKEGQVIHLSKIKMVVANDWPLSAADTKINVLGTNGQPVEGQTIETQPRPDYSWTDDKGVQHVATAGVGFSLKLQGKSEPVVGPWNICYYLKAVRSPAEPMGDAKMSVSLPMIPKPLPQGFTAVSSWGIVVGEDRTIAPGAVKDVPLAFYAANDGQPGVIKPGIHEVGIEITAKDDVVVYRGILKVEVK